MDGLQPYPAPGRAAWSPPATSAFTTAANDDVGPAKTPADYIRAVHRRVWLVLAVAVPLSVAVAIVAMKQRSIYRAAAEITIDPPQYDPALAALVSHELGGRDPEFVARYVPNKIAHLRSRSLAETALSDPGLTQAGVPSEEAVGELVTNLQTRQIPNSNRFQVTLEGTDPARTKRVLETLLDLFQRQARRESETKNDDTSKNAQSSLNKLNEELRTLDERIMKALTNSKTIGPGGKSLAEERYQMLGSDLLLKKSRLSDFQHQAWMTQMFPSIRDDGGDHPDGRITELLQLRDRYIGQLHQVKRLSRNFNSDPTAQHISDKLAQIMDALNRLQAAKAQPARQPMFDPSEAIVGQMQHEIEVNEQRSETLLKELRESMPEHQLFLNWLDDRNQTADQIRTMQDKLRNFDILSRSQKDPVTIPAVIAEPMVPVRPNRALSIAVGVILSFALGIGLVCLLEHFDHTVKVPEYLAIGLTLPLFGVIPRIRRTAPFHRGGHLWAAGVPESVEADAYRNLRASLIGSSARHGPIVTLLVTSAKAGEGKSTTALNLAATCARAGERTLLLDVDLRRPSLRDVFHRQDDRLARNEDKDPEAAEVGLVDVIRGDLPWQRTVVRTDLPNLDFIPTGDTRDIPIEVLGTVELRQLLIALAHHYDRVILDGPATLGLPDCRMLGPFVDAALLVVRSGAHGLRPLKRAKSFLEQSNVAIAGVVFNGLCEDLENWSSYGPSTPYGYPGVSGAAARPPGPGRSSGLEAPSDDPHAALPAASADAGSARV
jgi:capsular exopolysaccharide synthesis family protein